jgi:hypothetical protein
LVTLAEDVNRDFTVDFYDIVKTAGAFGSRLGSTVWSRSADVTDDGVVDIFDLVRVAISFGRI